jgi:hypothetical protein
MDYKRKEKCQGWVKKLLKGGKGGGGGRGKK